MWLQVLTRITAGRYRCRTAGSRARRHRPAANRRGVRPAANGSGPTGGERDQVPGGEPGGWPQPAADRVVGDTVTGRARQKTSLARALVAPTHNAVPMAA